MPFTAQWQVTTLVKQKCGEKSPHFLLKKQKRRLINKAPFFMKLTTHKSSAVIF